LIVAYFIIATTSTKNTAHNAASATHEGGRWSHGSR